MKRIYCRIYTASDNACAKLDGSVCRCHVQTAQTAVIPGHTEAESKDEDTLVSDTARVTQEVNGRTAFLADELSWKWQQAAFERDK